MQAKTRNANKRKLLLTILLIAALLFVALLPYLNVGLPTYDEIFKAVGLIESIKPEADMSVHFIDVGQGDSILVVSPGGDVLIDAGERGNSETVLGYLAELGVTELEYVIATHPHSDHIGSLPEVIDALDVKNIIMPRFSEKYMPTTSIYSKFLTSVKNSGAKVIAAVPGSEYQLGEMKFTVLSPDLEDGNYNNMSVVTLFEYQGARFLLQGDAEARAEERILENGFDVSADVIKLGHHGSSTSNTADYLDAVAPKYAVVMCGKDNDYGHPHGEVLKYLEENYIHCYRTDVSGSIVFEVVDGKVSCLNTEVVQ